MGGVSSCECVVAVKFWCTCSLQFVWRRAEPDAFSFWVFSVRCMHHAGSSCRTTKLRTAHVQLLCRLNRIANSYSNSCIRKPVGWLVGGLPDETVHEMSDHGMMVHPSSTGWMHQAALRMCMHEPAACFNVEKDAAVRHLCRWTDTYTRVG